MSTILIFDLDDTLYPESTYVDSGFDAVAVWLYNRFGWDKLQSKSVMTDVLRKNGRGAVFNYLIWSHGVKTKQLVKECVNVYRHHTPVIELYPEAKELINCLSKSPYLVTDGHKIVQDNKIKALNIMAYFKKIFITHRYGIKNAKPSLYCFNRIRILEKSSWDNLIYIADNPEKDFVNLNSVGAKTIRVLTGQHKDVVAKPGYDAIKVINSLYELPL